MPMTDTVAAATKRAAATMLRRVLHGAYDALDRRQRATDPLVPPRAINPNMRFTPRRATYAEEFVASGERIADMLVSYGRLQPFQSVLDIGCGIGRVARALTTRLAPVGRYEGFDVDPHAITWCQHAYRSRENFSFAHAPVGYVNVRGEAALPAEEYIFPYPDESFDLVVSVSVYTHLSQAIVRHYLSETRRVLRHEGVCVNTFFVIDPLAVDAMRDGRADRGYTEHGSGVFLGNSGNPNLGIGFAPDVLQSLHATNALAIVPPVHWGTWTGRVAESFVYQDVVVARKAADHAP
jgi:SAM-dependent methyltransferase